MIEGKQVAVSNVGNFFNNWRKALQALNCSLLDKSILCYEFMFPAAFISHFISLKTESIIVSMGIFNKQKHIQKTRKITMCFSNTEEYKPTSKVQRQSEKQVLNSTCVHSLVLNSCMKGSLAASGKTHFSSEPQ